MMTDIERIKKRLLTWLDRIDKDVVSIRASVGTLLMEIEQRGLVIDTLASDSEMLVAMLEVDQAAFVAITEQLDEHPENYERACLCADCRSYA